MSNTECRKEFEEWVMSAEDYRSGDLNTRFDDDELYINEDMQLDWDMWRTAWAASRAKPIVLPSLAAAFDQGRVLYSEGQIVRAIEAAGYRCE